MSERVAVTMSLVSHTNVGKTTLARTLLRRDVGEVLDQAHTTEESAVYELIATDDAVLRLWDTPGFGDSVRLLRRLERENNPVLWFLQQTWDRIADRPLWSSQQAMRTVRDDTDVVLYLVNATEDPAEAGYVGPELDLLSWTGRPILVLLNQTGADARRSALAERVAAWRRHTESWETVAEVLPLDAFNRCWVEESLLFEHVAAVMPQERRPAMERLKEAWDARNLEVFGRAVEILAGYLARAAGDREVLADKRPSRADKKAAMEALGRRLVGRTEDLTAALLAAHGLEGTPPAEVEKALDAFEVRGEEKIDPERGALWGGVVSGALSGLAADLMAGGLSFGGGLVAGAILGALGGAGLARGYQLATAGRRPEVRWSPAFLDRLAAQALLRYLAVAHFGRGRGPFELVEHPERWRDAVEAERAANAETWRAVWSRAAGRDSLDPDGDEIPEASAPSTPPAALPPPRRMVRLLDRTLRRILADAYPQAAGMLLR